MNSNNQGSKKLLKNQKKHLHLVSNRLFCWMPKIKHLILEQAVTKSMARSSSLSHIKGSSFPSCKGTESCTVLTIANRRNYSISRTKNRRFSPSIVSRNTFSHSLILQIRWSFRPVPCTGAELLLLPATSETVRIYDNNTTASYIGNFMYNV